MKKILALSLLLLSTFGSEFASADRAAIYSLLPMHNGVRERVPCGENRNGDKCYKAKNGKRYSVYGSVLIGTQYTMNMSDCWSANGWVIMGFDGVYNCVGPRNPNDNWSND